jgi:hypothetical protein
VSGSVAARIRARIAVVEKVGDGKEVQLDDDVTDEREIGELKSRRDGRICDPAVVRWEGYQEDL